ncbi:MAG: TraM recognition domain-containing protein [Vulcanimicrobiaceae bacterium]
MQQATPQPSVAVKGPPPRSVVLGSPERYVALSIEDLCRHTIIFGNSGSGKTTRAFNPMLLQILGRLDAGGFIIAAKAEAVHEAAEIATRAGREYLVIEPGSPVGLDLLTGSPDVDSMYLRDAFGRVTDDAKNWVDAAVTRCKNALRLLEAAGPQYYTFEALTSYIFDEAFASDTRIYVSEKVRTLPYDSDEAWTIREAIAYEEKRYNKFTPETRQAVQFAVSQLLEPLQDVQIAKTFARKRNLVSIDAVFAGKVIILHVPRSRYERAAQAIYTLAKRRFFTAVENRRANPLLNQDRPVVFGVDEYQLCISESDVQSLGTIRSAGCMVLATTQGVSSLYSVLARNQVDAALQNFTNKLFFKTDDDETLSSLGRARRGTGTSNETDQLLGMNRDQALCHLTAGDMTTDEVITMRPLFIGPSGAFGNAAGF